MHSQVNTHMTKTFFFPIIIAGRTSTLASLSLTVGDDSKLDFFFLSERQPPLGLRYVFFIFYRNQNKKIKLKLTIGLPRWVLLPFYTLLPFTLILIWFYYCRSSDWKFDSRRLKVISISDYSVILLEKKNTQAKEGVSL